MGRFWWNIQFFQRNYFFYRFRTFTDVHHLSAKFFRQVCRKCNLRVHRNILRRSLSLENFFVTTFITYWPRIFRPTVNFFDCVLKIAFYLYRKMVWARNNEKLKLFYLFGFWEKFFQVFFWKIVNGVVKPEFCIPRGSFCGKTFLLKKIIIFCHCRTLKEKRLDFVETVLAWMSNLHSTCPLEYFEEKGLCWKFFFSNYDPWTMSELFFWFLSKSFRTWYSKLQSACR